MHIEVAQLWVQDKVRHGEVKVIKVASHDNLTDALTNHVSSECLDRHLRDVGHRVEEGKSAIALVS